MSVPRTSCVSTDQLRSVMGVFVLWLREYPRLNTDTSPITLSLQVDDGHVMLTWPLLLTPLIQTASISILCFFVWFLLYSHVLLAIGSLGARIASVKYKIPYFTGCHANIFPLALKIQCQHASSKIIMIHVDKVFFFELFFFLLMWLECIFLHTFA